MYRLGSKFWLATSALISSLFAFLFALLVTFKLSLPMTAALSLEGVPFFVSTIGFEKHVTLTESILSHRLKPSFRGDSPGRLEDTEAPTHTVVRWAIGEVCPAIVKRYAVETLLLLMGACVARNTVGGLHSFCILAAWVLAFDCMLLISFFAAILIVKLEIARVGRQVNIGEILKDGISQTVAVEVARRTASCEASEVKGSATDVFSQPVRLSHFAMFKAVMVVVFVLVNAFNSSATPLRGTQPCIQSTHLTLYVDVTSYGQDDAPSSAAPSLLEGVLASAKENDEETVVTTLPPMTYQQNPAIGTAEYTRRTSE